MASVLLVLTSVSYPVAISKEFDTNVEEGCWSMSGGNVEGGLEFFFALNLGFG